MSRELEVVSTYDAPIDRVGTMLATREFREAVCVGQHSVSYDVQVTPSGAGHEMSVTQEHDVRGRVPGFVSKLVGDTLTLVQTESWTSPTAGDIVVSVPGKPVDIRGTAELVEDRGRTIETVRLRIKVSVPMVGGKIEDILKQTLGDAMAREREVGTTWLAEGRA